MARKKKETHAEIEQRFRHALQGIQGIKDVGARYRQIEAMEKDVADTRRIQKNRSRNKAELIASVVGVPVGVGSVIVPMVLLLPVIGPAAFWVSGGAAIGGMYGTAQAQKALQRKYLDNQKGLHDFFDSCEKSLGDMKRDILENHFSELRHDGQIEDLIANSPDLSQHFAKMFARGVPQKISKLPKPSIPKQKPS
ncbi:MAG: hypothetical protein OXT65_00960 [Alphaproteobacteria bacterium]|nr:hypothetical protein [Alphaproteobacteria bacterium]